MHGLALLVRMRCLTLLVRVRCLTYLLVSVSAQHYLACAHAWLDLASAHAQPVLVSVSAQHYLACAHAWLDLASAHAQPYLAGALPSPEDELAEVRISQVSLLPGQDSCTKSGHTTTTFKATFHLVLVVLNALLMNLQL